jgi:hypothetical protein
MGKKCDPKKCWKIIQDLSPILSSIYQFYFNTNESIIQDMYKHVSFNDTIDIAYFLQSFTSIRPVETNESNKIVDVYCFDSLEQTQTVKKLDISTYKPGKKWILEQCNTLFN